MANYPLVNWKDILGVWYEQGHTPNSFQNNDNPRNVTAKYTMNHDDPSTIFITNTEEVPAVSWGEFFCIPSNHRHKRYKKRTAHLLGEIKPHEVRRRRFYVRREGLLGYLVAGSYHIRAFDKENLEWMIVQSGENFWVLTRQKKDLPRSMMNTIRDVLYAFGEDWDAFCKVEHV